MIETSGREARIGRAPTPAASTAEDILRLIWCEGPVSRADIARQLDVSRSTASENVAPLLASGLVREGSFGESSGGRPPMMLEFQDEACAILGVDLGATHVTVATTDLRGRVLSFEERPHLVQTDPAGTRALILELGAEALSGSRVPLLGVGVAMPSPVGRESAYEIPRSVLRDWGGRTGFEELEERFGVPVFIDNDANLGALAEGWWGAGRGVDDFTYLKLGTGVGAGHMIRGRIYRGATGFAGEVGHISVDPGGERCMCGNRGCLGTVVGTGALLERTKILLAGGRSSSMDPKALSIDGLEAAALSGDSVAGQVVQEAAHALGIALSQILNLLNPSSVILGGSLTQLGDHFLMPIREAVFPRTLVSSVAAAELRVSDLGPRSTAVGASTLVLDAALRDPSLFPKIA